MAEIHRLADHLPEFRKPKQDLHSILEQFAKQCGANVATMDRDNVVISGDVLKADLIIFKDRHPHQGAAAHEEVRKIVEGHLYEES